MLYCYPFLVTGPTDLIILCQDHAAYTLCILHGSTRLDKVLVEKEC